MDTIDIKSLNTTFLYNVVASSTLHAMMDYYSCSTAIEDCIIRSFYINCIMKSYPLLTIR